MSLSEDKHTSTTAFDSVGFFIYSSICIILQGIKKLRTNACVAVVVAET
jgi:hypothetical protein